MPETGNVKKIVVLVVHGVGEQKRFEYLESFASQFYFALRKDKSRAPNVRMRYADQDARRSPEHSLNEAPAAIRWRSPTATSQQGNEEIEVTFREVHWADLNTRETPWNWVKLLFWSLSAPGVKLFRQGRVGPPEARGMCPPLGLSFLGRIRVRVNLFFFSLLFLMLLGTIGVAHQILKRLHVPIKIPIFETARHFIYSALSGVKLYQDWFERKDERLEAIGEKSRVAIRRRMVRELVRTAAEAERGEIAGFYIFAHSLGTVVAFNALMEPEVALPNYLPLEEFDQLPAPFRAVAFADIPQYMMPARPPWLDQGALPEEWNQRLPRDLIDRTHVLKHLRGVLTMGSPLNTFAALWPAIVPVQQQGLRKPAIPWVKRKANIPWINVRDALDIIGAPTTRLKPCPGSRNVGGFVLQDYRWSDQFWFFFAHNAYWSAKQSFFRTLHANRTRLIDQIIPWIEGGQFAPPQNAWHRPISRLLLAVSFFGFALVLLYGFSEFFTLALDWASTALETD